MLHIDSSWKFKEIKENIETIKSEYQGILLSFFWHQIKQKTEVIKKIKKQIFNFNNIQYWQRERLWEVLNDDLEIEKFRRLK